MRQKLFRLLAGLCVLGTVAALPAALAAQPKPETVRAAFWTGMNIYVDGVPIGFYTEDGWEVRPIEYRTSIYIPIRTAGEWLGGGASWDEKADTIALTRGDTPYYQNQYTSPDDASNDSDAWKEQMVPAIQNGFDLTLRPDVTVLLDGQPQRLVNATGETLSPVALWDHLYLPLESVAAMCGKQLTDSPLWPEVMEVWKDHDFSELYGAYQSSGHPRTINLYDQPTPEQLDSARQCLDKMEERFWAAAKAVEDLQGAGDSLTKKELKARINAIADQMTAIQQTSLPDAPFFSPPAGEIRSAAKCIIIFDLNSYTENLDAGLPASKLMSASNWGYHMFQCLYRMRTQLEYAKVYLQDVAAPLPTEFTDQADIVHTQAVSELVRLNILNGVKDGSAFAPKQTITRGEMAKMLAMALNGGTDPLLQQAYNGPGLPLSDLAGHWAQPYVTYCVNLGILSGRGDGTFGPDDPVSGRECAKMLLVAIGYLPEQEGFEGADWSVNVLVRANQIELFAGLEPPFDYMAPLSRDDAAQIVSNGLHADLVQYDSILTTVDGESVTRFVPRPRAPAESLFTLHYSKEA